MKRQSSVFLGGLGRHCSSKDLRAQFNMYGIIVDIHILRIEGESRDFAFVHYKNEEDVEHLVKLNLEIKVEARKDTMARARREGSPRACPSSQKVKALMKNSSSIRVKFVSS